MPGAVSALKAVLQLERNHVSGMSFSVGLDQFEHGINRARQGSGGDCSSKGAAGSDGE
ncbi:hypothetical protein GWE18_28410 [Bradyrhizobium sp. CSA112]|uniref:hypothetical protein n=1 Tax=Bradyrhizobium sp. CSA112 TaxID=2699170 RepID=UPI0023B0841D|nr:hypothetical protein [Bradyrhizobium sp. CSA112]MDE5456681.1 hypothetical protein [Bradyrhizobium sp. CSA112]